MGQQRRRTQRRERDQPQGESRIEPAQRPFGSGFGFPFWMLSGMLGSGSHESSSRIVEREVDVGVEGIDDETLARLERLESIRLYNCIVQVFPLNYLAKLLQIKPMQYNTKHRTKRRKRQPKRKQNRDFNQ